MAAPVTFTPAMLAEIRDAFLSAVGPLKATPKATPQASWNAFREAAERIEASREADYRERLARWRQNAPAREAAERAMRAANARRQRAGAGGPAPILAAAWADRPERTAIW